MVQLRRGGPSQAVLVVGMSVVLFALTGVVAYQHRVPSRDPQAGWPNAVWLASWLAYAVVGGLILHRLPGHWVGRLFTTISLSIQAAALLAALALAAQRAHWLSTVIAIAGWLSGLLFLAPQIALVSVLPLLYPSGQPPTGRRRVLLWASLAAGTVLLVGVAVAPGRLDGFAINNPVGLSAAPAAASAAQIAGAVGVIVTCILAAAALVVLWRRGGREDRRALAYLALAVGVVAIAVVSSVLLAALAGQGPRRYTGLLEAAALVALPVTTGLAILRARLFDIELVLRRTLTYVVVSALVTALYVLTILALGDTLRVDGRVSVSLVVLAIAATGLSPLREQIQRRVDRVLYGRRGDPYGVLRDLDHRLTHTTSSADVLPTLADAIASGLRVPYVCIGLHSSSGGPSVDVEYGSPQPVSRQLDLHHHGLLVGHLKLAARSPGERFSVLDEQLLTQVVDHASVAVAAVQLSIEAQQSRERLVRTLEDDRRRIRRDLHDHLGPVLGGVSLQLDALRRLSKDQPELYDLASTIRDEVSDAIHDVRHLVHGMRPPVLDELGLAEAVRHYAASLTDAIAVTTIDVHDLPPLPAAVEVAAFRIVSEALTNTVRHSRAATARVDLHMSAEHEQLIIHVVDTGIGLPPQHVPGVGLQSMRERAAELGGTLHITSAHDGTTVHAELPAGSR
jgi:signal transduction histidine kinase